jgi:hypothetical protein
VPNIPSDIKHFLEELNLDNDKNILKLVVGDINCNSNKNLDRNELENFLQKFDLNDIYRKVKRTGKAMVKN